MLLTHKEKKIILFSHSFGTYILIKAIERIIKKNPITNISTIILSGSVLKSNYNFSKLKEKTTARIVNDCGSSDGILLISQALVPFAGMAGKIGFKGINDTFFTNRYFKGGHSHYFLDDGLFMKHYWVPLFSEASQLEVIDKRTNSFWEHGVIDTLASFIGKFKELAYLLLIIYVGIYVF